MKSNPGWTREARLGQQEQTNQRCRDENMIDLTSSYTCTTLVRGSETSLWTKPVRTLR
jgi:hypothetical protein